jgi:DNA-binding SARP family transcriptional activator
MKKVYPARQPEEAGLVDIAIQSQAEKSNTEDEILTETMAEVLAQQGKISKAIEVYQKLSLLNPSKSAYFAAKIESIS